MKLDDREQAAGMTVAEALELRDAAYATGWRDGADETRKTVANALSLTDRMETA